MSPAPRDCQRHDPSSVTLSYGVNLLQIIDFLLWLRPEFRCRRPVDLGSLNAFPTNMSDVLYQVTQRGKAAAKRS